VIRSPPYIKCFFALFKKCSQFFFEICSYFPFLPPPQTNKAECHKFFLISYDITFKKIFCTKSICNCNWKKYVQLKILIASEIVTMIFFGKVIVNKFENFMIRPTPSIKCFFVLFKKCSQIFFEIFSCFRFLPPPPTELSVTNFISNLFRYNLQENFLY